MTKYFNRDNHIEFYFSESTGSNELLLLLLSFLTNSFIITTFSGLKWSLMVIKEEFSLLRSP